MIDANSGNLIGEYDAPKFQENSNLSFFKATTLDPETGRIYTTDFKNVYCIETVR